MTLRNCWLTCIQGKLLCIIYTSLFLEGKRKRYCSSSRNEYRLVKINFCKPGKTQIEVVSLGSEMVQNSIPWRTDGASVVNARCSDVLVTDRYRWNTGKINTMLSTNKIQSLNFQSSKAYMLFLVFARLVSIVFCKPPRWEQRGADPQLLKVRKRCFLISVTKVSKSSAVENSAWSSIFLLWQRIRTLSTLILQLLVTNICTYTKPGLLRAIVIYCSADFKSTKLNAY